MNSNFTLLLLFSSFLISCSTLKTADRTELQTDEVKREYVTLSHESNITNFQSDISDEDLTKYSYELGYDPQKGLSTEEKLEVKKRYQVRKLERTLDSEKERRHYSKIVPYLMTDQEKIDYLSIPSIEGRQAWVIRNKIWARAKSSKDFLDIVEVQDLTLGMTQDLVKKSWGDPESVEISGNIIYKNEKWRYIRDVPTANGYKRERRFVFFEGGRVIGWETE